MNSSKRLPMKNTMSQTFPTARAALILTLLWSLPTPALSKEICSVPKAQWRPQGALTQKLEGEGWKIRNLKIDSGCYEVYGTDGSGKARETHFNPQSFKPAAENHKSY